MEVNGKTQTVNINVAQLNKDRKSCFMLACEQGHMDLVEYLYNQLLKLSSEKRNNPGFEGVYEFDINAGDSWGDAALHLATRASKTKVVEFLLPMMESGGGKGKKEILDINKQDKQGFSAPMLAIMSGNKILLDKYLEKEKDIDFLLTTGLGQTSLLLSIPAGIVGVILSLIEKFDAKLIMKPDTKAGETSLMEL